MILSVHHIAKRFGKKTVLKEINFEMSRGAMYGIVGENGSGKSTLIKIIVGHLKSQKGHLTINGTLGYCPQEPLLFHQLTVNEHFQYFSDAYKIDRSELKIRSDELSDHFNFREYLDERISNLSGGTQQKLNLVLALLHNPDLLVLDEPYNGFDWDTYRRFWEYAESVKQKGTSILIVAHLINEQQRFDKIYDLKNGYLK